MNSREELRAVVLAVTLVLSLLAVVPAPVTPVPSASVDVADDAAGATTVHNWTTSTSYTGTLTDVRLNYSTTGTNVSTVTSGNLNVTVDGTVLPVHDVSSVENDEVLEVNVTNTSLVGGEVIRVNASTDQYVNPKTMGTHYAAIELLDSGSTFQGASAAFTIVGRNTVDGTVTNSSDSSAVAGATVSVFDDNSYYSDTTDGSGNFAVDVPDGTYTVRVDPDGYVANQTDGVQVSGGATLTTDLAVEPAGTLNGTVTNDSGSPVAGATVSATDSGNNYYSTTTDGSGDYELEVPAGTYTVEADNASYAPTSVDGVGAIVGENTTTALTLNDAAIISVTVTDPSGNPVSGATVETYDSNYENFQRTTKDQSGTYELEVANGTYVVEVTASGYASTRKTGVAATEGQTTTLGVALVRAATIDGTVTDAQGNPLGSAEVVVHDDGYQTYQVTSTDPQGRYSIQVAPGTYTVRADKGGYARSTHTVEGTAGSTTTRDFSLGQPAVITGTVTDSKGSPVTNAFVVADDGENYYYNRTNASGGYSIDVPAGDYTVTAQSSGAMGSGGYHEGLVTGSTYTVDVDVTIPTIHHTSVRHVGGTAPAKGTIDVNTQVMGGMIAVQLVDDTPNGMPQDLSDSNVDRSTVFEINLTVEDYDPNTLLWGVRDVNWSSRPNGTIAGATDVTIRTKAVNLQGIDKDPSGSRLPVGPVRDYEGVSWPTGSDDKADRGWNNTVYFGVFDMSNVPSEVAGDAENMTIATNAQAFSRPQLTDAGLKVYVAGPHLTTYDAEHDGFYDAFIPNAQLDSWGVDDPSADLNALYKGDSSNFQVEETEDGAWIRLDISYSDGTVEIEPDTGGGSGGGSGGSYSGSSDDSETPTPTTSTPTVTGTATPTTTSPPTAADGGGAATAEATARPSPDPATTAPAETTAAPGQPGFGVVVALVALVAVFLRRRHP